MSNECKKVPSISIFEKDKIDWIEDLIVAEECEQFDEKCIVCILTLRNGYKVSGIYVHTGGGFIDNAYGEDVARNQALQKIYELEKYLEQQREYEKEQGLKSTENTIAELVDNLVGSFKKNVDDFKRSIKNLFEKKKDEVVDTDKREEKDTMNNDWRHIPGFNGYMINSDGFVLSFKNFNKNPNGQFLKHNNGYYTLTNNENERKRVHYTELLKLCDEADSNIGATGGTYKGSRNLIRPAKDGKVHISKFFKPTEISDKELE